jgi:hypothetical protein
MALKLVPLLNDKPQQIDRDLISLLSRVRKELLIFFSEPCSQRLERLHDLFVRPQREVQGQIGDDAGHLLSKFFVSCAHCVALVPQVMIASS